MKKLIQNIKMAGLMAMALIACPTTITAQSAKYDAKTVNAVTERFVAYAKINSQGTDTSDMDAFPLNPGQREMARKVEADLQAILRGTSATVTRSESEYVYVKIPANAKGIPSVMFMAHLDITPEAPGGNITPVVHRGYGSGLLHRTNCAAETSVGKPWRAGIHTLLHHDARGDHGRRKLDGGESALALF